MVDHDAQVLPSRKFNQLFRLLATAGERLFNENVLTVLQRRFGQFIMRPHWRYHRYHVDINGGHQFGGIPDDPHVRMGLLYSLPGLRTLIAYRNYGGPI